MLINNLQLFDLAGEDCWDKPSTCPPLLEDTALNDRLQECLFSFGNPDAFLWQITRLLRCLTTRVQLGTKTYNDALATVWNTLLKFYKPLSGAMKCAVGACQLCIGCELALLSGCGGLPENVLENKVHELSALHQRSPELSTYLSQMVDLSQERNLPEVVQLLRQHVELIQSGVLSYDPEEVSAGMC